MVGIINSFENLHYLSKECFPGGFVDFTQFSLALWLLFYVALLTGFSLGTH